MTKNSKTCCLCLTKSVLQIRDFDLVYISHAYLHNHQAKNQHILPTYLTAVQATHKNVNKCPLLLNYAYTTENWSFALRKPNEIIIKDFGSDSHKICNWTKNALNELKLQAKARYICMSQHYIKDFTTLFKDWSTYKLMYITARIFTPASSSTKATYILHVCVW